MARLADILNSAYLADANKLPQALTTIESAARTEDELRAEAERSIGSLYNQKTLATQQQYDRTQGSLKTQLNSLADTYAQHKETVIDQTKKSVSEADRRGLTRGMGRSSYLQATLGNVQASGDKLLNQVNTAQTNQTNAINSQLQLADQQLGEILSAYQVDKELDIMAQIDKLRSTDKQDSRAATEYNNNLILALAERIAAQKSQEFEQDMATKNYNLSQQELNMRYAPQVAVSGNRNPGGTNPGGNDPGGNKDIINKYLLNTANVVKDFGTLPLKGLPKVNPAPATTNKYRENPFNYNTPYSPKSKTSTLMSRLQNLTA